MTASTDIRTLASGLAALSLCESLLLEMTYRNILGHREVFNLVSDAVAAHHGNDLVAQDRALNDEIIRILERVLANSDAVRRSLDDARDG